MALVVSVSTLVVIRISLNITKVARRGRITVGIILLPNIPELEAGRLQN